MKPRVHVVLLAFLLFAACADRAAEDEALRAALEPVRQKYAPDRRLAVFDIRWERHGSLLAVKGDVGDAAAKEEVFAAIRGVAHAELLDSVSVLPHPSLGETRFGIVTVSVGNMRSRPSHPAELSTQVLMGTVVSLLKREGGWFYVQSPDGYLSWLEDEAVAVTDAAGVEAWMTAPRVIVLDRWVGVRVKPSPDAELVAEAVLGGTMKTIGRVGPWVHVELPDGVRGYVERTAVQDVKTWEATRKLTAENIEATARMFLGVPYLWGGTSVKGFDCSGFTKMVFLLNGFELTRDADQQARMGEEVVPGNHFEHLQRGDLLYFGRKALEEVPERITHVGIYLSDREFIHAPGGSRVRINSLDSTAANFSERLFKSFVRARRYAVTAKPTT